MQENDTGLLWQKSLCPQTSINFACSCTMSTDPYALSLLLRAEGYIVHAHTHSGKPGGRA